MVFRALAARWSPQISKTAELAPACCNACRTCWTTNLVGLATAGGAAVTAFVLGRRRSASPP